MKNMVLSLILLGVSVASASEVKPSSYPVREWQMPNYAMMGGISDCSNELPYYGQYLNYLETLAKTTPVVYFTNTTCQKYISTKINTSNIKFVDYSLNSIWIRDYAPIWLQNTQTQKFQLVNFPYGANFFGKQSQDDGFSAFLAKSLNTSLALDFERKQPQYYFDGGNLLVDENNVCYTGLLQDDFPPEVRRNLLSQINCTDVIIMEPIPGEKTGHVDTFMKILPGKKVILAQYKTQPYKDAMERNKQTLQSRGFEVIDIPHINRANFTNWSYANSVIVGGKAFVPQYGFTTEDATALDVFAKLGYEVQPIPADKIMNERGSLHCITNFGF